MRWTRARTRARLRLGPLTLPPAAQGRAPHVHEERAGDRCRQRSKRAAACKPTLRAADLLLRVGAESAEAQQQADAADAEAANDTGFISWRVQKPRGGCVRHPSESSGRTQACVRVRLRQAGHAGDQDRRRMARFVASARGGRVPAPPRRSWACPMATRTGSRVHFVMSAGPLGTDLLVFHGISREATCFADTKRMWERAMESLRVLLSTGAARAAWCLLGCAAPADTGPSLPRPWRRGPRRCPRAGPRRREQRSAGGGAPQARGALPLRARAGGLPGG
jgi:hypothetical protein